MSTVLMSGQDLKNLLAIPDPTGVGVAISVLNKIVDGNLNKDVSQIQVEFADQMQKSAGYFPTKISGEPFKTFIEGVISSIRD